MFGMETPTPIGRRTTQPNPFDSYQPSSAGSEGNLMGDFLKAKVASKKPKMQEVQGEGWGSGQDSTTESVYGDRCTGGGGRPSNNSKIVSPTSTRGGPRNSPEDDPADILYVRGSKTTVPRYSRKPKSDVDLWDDLDRARQGVSSWTDRGKKCPPPSSLTVTPEKKSKATIKDAGSWNSPGSLFASPPVTKQTARTRRIGKDRLARLAGQVAAASRRSHGEWCRCSMCDCLADCE